MMMMTLLLLIGLALVTRALSADRTLTTVGRIDDLNRFSHPVAAGAHIYHNAFVGLDPAGYAKPFVPGDVFAGVADAAADNTSGSAGNLRVNCWLAASVVHALSGVAQADVLKPVYATADNALALTGHPDAFAGRVLGVDAANYALVRLKAPGERPPEDGSSIDLSIDFARYKFAANDEAAASYPVPLLLNTNIGAGLTAGTTGLLRDESTGEAKLLLDNDSEAENITLETPQVFNITKGVTFDLEGRNSVAGGAATDDMDFGLIGLAGGITATERANMNAATAGLLSALFHIDTNALALYGSSDDNASPIAATDLTPAANILATNQRFKIIVRPTGAAELWVNEVRRVATTAFSVGAAGLLAGIVNLEKSTGAGVPEARLRKWRVAGAIA